MEKITKQQILDDLFALDPSLRERESELSSVIDKLAASRPETDWDEAFARELRQRLLTEFKKNSSMVAANKIGWLAWFPNTKLVLVGGSLAIVIVAAIAVTSVQPWGTTPSSTSKLSVNQKTHLAGGLIIEHTTTENAFGPLTGTSTGPIATQSAGSGSATGTTFDQSAPSNAFASPIAPTPALPPSGATVSGTGTSEAVRLAPNIKGMPIYRPTIYKFTYDGTLTLTDSKVAVLARQPGIDATALNNDLAGINLGLIDLGRLTNAKVQNLTLTEDRDFGYVTNVNLDDGSVSISQNWSRWPQAQMKCAPDGSCPSPAPLSLSDIPADADLISLARAFLGERGISLDGYGEPQVDTSWRQSCAAPADTTNCWVPDQMTILFPLVIEGLPVYTNDGRGVGINVYVDIRNHRAAGADNIVSQKYTSSDYAAETDATKLLESINAGGIMPMYGAGPGITDATTVEIKLGEPIKCWYSTWKYDNNRSQNLLVPALAFPIDKTNTDAAGLYANRVVVPLAADLVSPQPILYGGLRTVNDVIPPAIESAGSGKAMPSAVTVPTLPPVPKSQ